MQSTLTKIERLIEEIGGAPPDEEGTLERLHGALDAVGARLREYVAEAGTASEGEPSPADRADRMADEARRIGHDLNNCLGVVGGRAELMELYLDRGKVDDVRRGIEVILGQMDRMRELTDELRGLRRRPGGPA
jgi:signal transduction histidine kinase